MSSVLAVLARISLLHAALTTPPQHLADHGGADPITPTPDSIRQGGHMGTIPPTHLTGPASAPTTPEHLDACTQAAALPQGPGGLVGATIVAPAGFLSWAGLLAILGATTPAKVMLAGAILTLPLAARAWWVWR